MTTDEQVPAKAIPRMVGRYHLLEEVGRSTFGPLHLARFEGPGGFQRWSSILEVESRFSRDSEFRRAFFQSARTAARIQHPNVVATLDVGETEHEKMLWLASEYLLGETAKELLTAAQQRAVPVPWDIACRIIADAALGLDAIHELAHSTTGAPMQLVHGRLAPYRLVVTYDGTTKVLEPSAPFVALSPGQAGQAKTMVGRAVAYTAPELLRGDAFDRRVDIFSLGVILWELCAGRRLFGGRDESETRAKIHANTVPPLSESVRGFPAEVEGLIRQMLAPDPALRMQNAKALARALHQSLVKESLVVTDDAVARYLLHAFPERLPKKKSRLLSAADVTHVFRKDSLQLFTTSPAPAAPVPRVSTPPAPRASTPPVPRPSTAPMARGSMQPALAFPPQWGAPPRARADAGGLGPRLRSVPPILFVVLGVAVAVVAALIVVVVRLAHPIDVSAAAAAPVPPVASSSTTPLANLIPTPIPTPLPRASSSVAAPRPTPPRPALPSPSLTSVSASAASNKGRLTVICDPACDDVRDGKVSLGPSPIYKHAASLGTHHLTLRITDPPTEKVVDVVVGADDVAVLKQSMAK